MRNSAPKMPPLEQELYLRSDPAISFRIERIIHATRKEVFQAWTEARMFRRWIEATDQQVDTCTIEPNGTVNWKSSHPGVGSDMLERKLDCATRKPYRLLEFNYSTSEVEDTQSWHPINMTLELGIIWLSNGLSHTKYSLELDFHTSALWRHASSLDIHTFWMDATQRLAHLLEQRSMPTLDAV